MAGIAPRPFKPDPPSIVCSTRPRPVFWKFEQQEQRKKDRYTTILFRRQFSVFCRAGGEDQVRDGIRARDALSTVNNRIVVVVVVVLHE